MSDINRKHKEWLDKELPILNKSDTESMDSFIRYATALAFFAGHSNGVETMAEGERKTREEIKSWKTQ